MGSSASDSVLLGIEANAVTDFRNRYGYEPRSGPAGNDAWASDVRKMVVALDLIANNGQDLVGGGGIARRDPAPPFSN